MPNTIEQLPEGGMGIKIISQIADDIRYTRTQDNKNCLFISKVYEQEPVKLLPKCHQKNLLARLLCFCRRLTLILGNYFRKKRIKSRYRNLKLTVNSDLNAVEQILDWYGQIQHLPIPQQVWQLGQIALVEAFTNVVRHAHKGLSKSTPVELEITVSNHRLDMKIWDYGQPFDLDAKLKEL
ncbi:ATP-binding protein [Coleofasciculus sp. G2-EDA-02]|uniref:ATP-binding protein n=1 Tax=Coleofasciculus sp. G2-EDA-02 TaxID=3069529 RepID=UPI0032F4D15F